MTMRVDCRHYQSRTYANGEAVRKCVLDLAPEAPWRCPAECPKYERKMIDAARKIIVVADHTKFGRGAVTPLAPLDTPDVVVSDSGLAPEHQELLRSQNVQVLLA